MAKVVLIDIRDDDDEDEAIEALLDQLGLDERSDYHLQGQHDQATHNPHLGADEKTSVEAKFLTGRAKNAEPQATKVLQEAIGQFGGRMYGLDYKIKTGESLERKMKQRVAENPGLTPTDVALGISDALRYTAVFNDGNYAKGVKSTLGELQASGFAIEKVKNYWHPGDTYDGINVAMKNQDGLKIELQFHTGSSIDVKENKSHPIYEKLRVAKDPKEAKLYKDQLSALWHSVAIPVGAMTIGNLMMA